MKVLEQTSKSQRLIGYITRDLYDNESLTLMHKVCVRPLLEYCTSILSSVCIKDKLGLQSVQRRFALRILGTNCTLSYNPRCNKLGLVSLWKRRLELDLIFFFKILDKLSFTSSQVIQYAETSNHDIRNSLSPVKQTHSKSSLCINYFTCKFSRLWNNLPQSICKIKTFSSFVRCIDAYCSIEYVLNVLALVILSYSTSEIIGTLNF
ncbi:hypothetical protein MS3_00006778 [Schistosoma haematobium]|uniref:Uncharacterized protein n=2 Tax=Schistosoma haematobium TaxID=6185 RepID=A0A6A5DLB8_SCHHA|nr:hypothetical protein MS3_00006778 [Schistosoma haematobium]KAH9585566.1 hypothetical protein MS3_00006778 [Schistosoma haematobium]